MIFTVRSRWVLAHIFGWKPQPSYARAHVRLWWLWAWRWWVLTR